MLVCDNSYIMVWGNFHIKVTFSIYAFFLLMFKMTLGLDFVFHLSLDCVNILLVFGVHPNLLTNDSFIFHEAFIVHKYHWEKVSNSSPEQMQIHLKINLFP